MDSIRFLLIATKSDRSLSLIKTSVRLMNSRCSSLIASDTITHGRDQEIPDVGTVHRSNADANFFLRARILRPLCRDELSSCDARISDAGNFLYLCLRIFFRRFLRGHSPYIQSPTARRESSGFQLKMQAKILLSISRGLPHIGLRARPCAQPWLFA